MLRVVGTGPKEEAWGNRTHRFVVTLGATLLFTVAHTPFCSAQDYGHDAVSIIDGSEHPELIPDPVAYRLYFSTVSLQPHPTAEQAQLQVAQVGAISLSDQGKRVIIEQLAIFRAKFDAFSRTTIGSYMRGGSRTLVYLIRGRTA